MKTNLNTATPKLSLGRKLLIVVITFTGLFAANFIAYNYLLRELDRTGTAVDAAGRQRMLSQKIAYMAFQVGAGHDKHRGTIKELTAEFQETLEAFKHGGFSRNFFVHPAPESMAQLLRGEEAAWKPYRNAALLLAAAPAGGPSHKKALGYIKSNSETLLSACDAVTTAFRDTAEIATHRMELLLLLLVGLNLLFGARVFNYAEKKIVAPLVALNRAAAEITAGNFPQFDAAASEDEVGNLSRTFSKMSATISKDIEKRSAITSLLAISLEHGSMPEMLGKFLESLLEIPWLAAEAKGSIFLAAPTGSSLVMAAQRGIAGETAGQCDNVPFGRCLCGKAAASGRTVFSADIDERHEIYCAGMKPHGHYCLPIKARDTVIGVLNLYLPAGHERDDSEQAFLEAAASIIAKAIDYKKLEGSAYQAQKMESLGKAAGAIAHDFNNILTGIKGFNELARETVPPGSEAERFVRETGAGIEKGTALVKQILAFSRKQPAEMARLDLNSVVEGLQAMLGVVLEKKIRVKLSLAAGLPAIKANKGQLEQVIVNLAINARDAMLPKGGEFTITTAEVSGESSASCAAKLRAVANVVRLTVSDTGSGMPEEIVEHIFEPFFTTKPEGEGTGLGLATVYSIVQLHNGDVKITSRPGQGTTFDICFPADNGQG